MSRAAPFSLMKLLMFSVPLSFYSASSFPDFPFLVPLGQMHHTGATKALQDALKDPRLNAMVRHEAAEALGAIADPEVLLSRLGFSPFSHLLRLLFFVDLLNCALISFSPLTLTSIDGDDARGVR